MAEHQSSSSSIGDLVPDGEIQDQKAVDGSEQGGGRVLPLLDGHVHSVVRPVQPAVRHLLGRSWERGDLRGGLTQDLHVQPEGRLDTRVSCD